MTRLDRIHKEIARVEGLLDSLHSDWNRLRWSSVLLVATPVIAFFSFGWAAAYFFFVGSFVATAYYLIEVRKREYTGELKQMHRDIQIVENLGESPPLT